jgi:hypothetical protein
MNDDEALSFLKNRTSITFRTDSSKNQSNLGYKIDWFLKFHPKVNNASELAAIAVEEWITKEEKNLAKPLPETLSLKD